MNIYQKRRESVRVWMKREGVALAVIEDFEAKRDPALRWLSGHPMDALLFLSANGGSLLVPWDVILAEKIADADKIVPFTAFDRDTAAAIEGAIRHFGVEKGRPIELPSATTYPAFCRLREKLPGHDLLCREDGLRDMLNAGRAVKDAAEIAVYRQVSAITDELIGQVEQGVKIGKLKTETDVALFIEREARLRGCEGTGFETLCAGPERSFGIHCFPAYTNGPFATTGFSILDFGLVYQGYTSDVTMTFAREPLSARQEEMFLLVLEAAAIGIAAVRPGVRGSDVGKTVNAFFTSRGVSMPHGLGHGIGLEAHEAPSLVAKDDNKWILQPGMIVTVEPGLYEKGAGGCRLENDVLVTENGNEVLTSSRIVRL
ncbi:MAG: Xaa-Pro peptidase family protein [Spirochaetaceae bacterium]|jgi:Xaa-Pro dipeptidase|nr:Xaa-Pro peptidase family protein [Spirochaetaceae bacterium]